MFSMNFYILRMFFFSFVNFFWWGRFSSFITTFNVFLRQTVSASVFSCLPSYTIVCHSFHPSLSGDLALTSYPELPALFSSSLHLPRSYLLTVFSPNPTYLSPPGIRVRLPVLTCGITTRNRRLVAASPQLMS